MYKDGKAGVRSYRIKVVDDILLERKLANHVSPYDLRSYKAKEVKGTQVKGETDRVTKTRESQK